MELKIHISQGSGGLWLNSAQWLKLLLLAQFAVAQTTFTDQWLKALNGLMAQPSGLGASNSQCLETCFSASSYRVLFVNQSGPPRANA